MTTTETPEAVTPADATKWLVWSNEHRAWWGPNHTGYTSRLEDAGRYSFEEALAICENANRHTSAPYEAMFMEDPALAVKVAEARGEARGRGESASKVEALERQVQTLRESLKYPRYGDTGRLLLKLADHIDERSTDGWRSILTPHARQAADVIASALSSIEEGDSGDTLSANQS